MLYNFALIYLNKNVIEGYFSQTINNSFIEKHSMLLFDLWKEGGPQMLVLFKTATPTTCIAAGVVGTLHCYVFIYHYGILNITISFLDPKDALLYLQGLFFVSVYISIICKLKSVLRYLQIYTFK